MLGISPAGLEGFSFPLLHNGVPEKRPSAQVEAFPPRLRD